MTDTAGVPAPITTPRDIVLMSEAKADKATLERIILGAVRDYEERTDCRVVGVQIDWEKRADGEWRTASVKASVQL